MMKNMHVSLEELSAYLDGESSRVREVEDHLASCPECTRRLAEWRSLSQQLHDMPVPCQEPYFTQNVLNRLEYTQRQSYRPWLSYLIAIAAVVLLVIGGEAFRIYQLWGKPSPMVAMVAKTADVAISEKGEDVSLGGFTEDWEQWGEAFSPTSEDSTEESTGSEVLAALADTPWFTGMVRQWEDQVDIDTLLCSLTPSEANTLKQLLQDYQQEGQSI